MVHLTTNVAEYAIIINEKNEFLMVQWGKGFDYSWHFPGGRLDEGDQEIEGLKREVREELDVEIEVIKPVFTKFIDEKILGSNHKPRFALFYLAKLKDGEKIKLNEDEHVAYKWYSKEDIDRIKFWMPFYKEMLSKVISDLE